MPAASQRTALGGLILRGTVEEIGEQRLESVNLSAGNAMSGAVSSAMMAVPRAIGVILAIVFAPLRMLLIPSLMGGGRRSTQPDQLQVPVTPFVVRGEDGTHYDCVLRGEARGGFLKLGEPVEVNGRIDRSRVVRVDRVRSLKTQAVTRGWVDPRARMATARTVAGVVFLVLMILFLIALIGTFAR